MKYQLAQHSLRGSRPSNQDRAAVAESENAVFMVVADGLGGHRGGEVAAELLVQTITHAFQTIREPVITRPSAFLALSILQAHRVIVARGLASDPPLEPRTTCVLCLIQNGYAYWAHVGDSRLYHFRGNHLLTRTQDHTTVEELRQDGLLSDEDMTDHPYKSRLLNCVGGSRKPSISLGEETRIHKGDVLLLCSDGLWEAYTPEQMARYLGYASLDEGVEEMLLTAERKMKQNCDNITALSLRWEDAATTSLPLQGNASVSVDQNRLWSDARQWAAETKIRERGLTPDQSRPKSERKRSVENRIQEIEEFIRRFEPKR